MATSVKQLSDRVSQLMSLADDSFKKENTNRFEYLLTQFRASSLSFIHNLYGENHPFYTEFNKTVLKTDLFAFSLGRSILASIKNEIDSGWLTSFKGLVSAEIFSDFLEMAEHLLKEKYKDAAAVIIGSALEGYLRQLCLKQGISTNDPKTGKPKKANLLNAELAKAVYNLLDQQNVTAWLELRNKAAHGNYAEYNQLQVENMMQAVTEFMARNSV